MEIKQKYIKDGSGNIVSPVTSSKSVYNESGISLSRILPNNGGCHNGIFRGEDITDLFYDGTLTKEIANATFDDIFIGDYILGQSTNRCYLVAGLDYRYLCGETNTTTHHVLMVPLGTFGTAQMNSSETTEGAYVGSEMYTTNLETTRSEILNDFGEEHILIHKNYFSNAVLSNHESTGAWYDNTIDLMNEVMVYGSRFYNNCDNGTGCPNILSIDKSQLPLFRLRPEFILAKSDNRNRNKWFNEYK